MVSKPLIIVGPKKTASSTFYTALKKKKMSYELLPKESNNLIKFGVKKNLRIYSKNVIDISPEYFSSYRAFATLRELVETGEIEPQILIVRRNEEGHTQSYINYMCSKNLLDSDFIKPEWETLFLQSEFELFSRLWKTKFKTKIVEFDDLISADKFLSEYLDIELRTSKIIVNKGDKEFTYLAKIFIYPISQMLRRVLPALIIEKISHIGVLRSLSFKEKSSNYENLIAMFKSRK